MMKRVVSWPVDDLLQGMTCDHVRIVDEDGPNIDGHEHGEVEVTLHREEEDEEMIWETLRTTINGMERVRCERRGY